MWTRSKQSPVFILLPGCAFISCAQMKALTHDGAEGLLLNTMVAACLRGAHDGGSIGISGALQCKVKPG